MTGDWRLLGSRRKVRATLPADEPTLDLTHAACERMLQNADNRLLGTQARIEALLAHLALRHRWAGKSRDEALAEVKFELFDLLQFVEGKAK